MGNTKIEWTDATWNPVTGCTKVSPGCAHCYAEAVAPRTFRGRPFTDVRFHPERLNQPRGWRKPRRVFVNSMSDLFHDDLSFDQIDQIFYVMSATPRHTYQILTKRHERMRRYLSFRGPGYFYNTDSGNPSAWPLPNVWLGVSVENQAMADERIPLLLSTPAAVRFISAEPLLGPINLWPYVCTRSSVDDGITPMVGSPRLDWVIVGGESGSGARPCAVRWIRKVMQDCRPAGVPVFVKQLGRIPYWDRDDTTLYLRDRKGGDPSEWPADLRVREMPR